MVRPWPSCGVVTDIEFPLIFSLLLLVLLCTLKLGLLLGGTLALILCECLFALFFGSLVLASTVRCFGLITTRCVIFVV